MVSFASDETAREKRGKKESRESEREHEDGALYGVSSDFHENLPFTCKYALHQNATTATDRQTNKKIKAKLPRISETVGTQGLTVLVFIASQCMYTCPMNNSTCNPCRQVLPAGGAY